MAARAHWGSRVGFILAAAGSAVGLGNIWKFPYVTGENGGGVFVLVYLLCVALVGLPVMVAEILIGRSTQCSPVGAFKSLAGPRSFWVSTGWLGVASAFVIGSFYSIVAGWSLHYTWLSLTGNLVGRETAAYEALFGGVFESVGLNQDFHFGPGTATVYTRSAPNSTSFHAEPCTSPLLVVARAGSTAHSR